jgi:hypothetical protein
MPPPCEHSSSSTTKQLYRSSLVCGIATLLIELCDRSRNQNEQVTALRIRLMLVIIGLNRTDRSCCVAPSLPNVVFVSFPTDELRLRSTSDCRLSTECIRIVYTLFLFFPSSLFFLLRLPAINPDLCHWVSTSSDSPSDFRFLFCFLSVLVHRRLDTEALSQQ